MGAPYAAVASQVFQALKCSCCTIKKMGCPRCARSGHKTKSSKKKFSCHTEKKKQKTKPQPQDSKLLVKAPDCASHSPIGFNAYAGDPFLAKHSFFLPQVLNFEDVLIVFQSGILNKIPHNPFRPPAV